MEQKRLSFGYSSNAPFIEKEGIALAAGGHQDAKAPVMIRGCCKIKKDNLSFDKTDIATSIFVTAIELFSHAPTTANLVGNDIVHAEDVFDSGEAYVLYFAFDLLQTLGLCATPSNIIIHAACYGHISNFIYIQQSEEKRK